MCLERNLEPKGGDRAGDTPVMLILDLCGGTGAWSKPYADAGYPVKIVDKIHGDDARLLQRERGVRGILAAPVCTVFSYARNRYPPTEAELLQALSLVDACLRIVFAHRIALAWWALENPINKLRRYIGPPRLAFYQWQYGDEGHKTTGIWGEFTEPFKKPRPRRKPSTYKTSKENASPIDAVTPAGFAQAFFEVNP
jgi:hypothetical protein